MWTLTKTDHGIDGWDARTTIEAYFTSHVKALQWLAKRDFTWEEYGSYYHEDIRKRNTMGAISYHLGKAHNGPPVDPE